jgi:5'-methylthioadenosine phosphorylase
MNVPPINSGLYQLEGLKVLGEVKPLTPWGYPSDSIVISETAEGLKVAFLARHGRGHYLTPTEVPSRANIAALKHLGVEVILSFSAVGSLREEIAPRDFIVPSQIVDRTKGVRPFTFYENGCTAHSMFADPFDTSLASLILQVAKEAVPEVKFHADKTLVVMEGPQFSTRAESHMYRSWGCDLINMSALPEAKLAKEAEIAYQMICMSTDYDCWRVGEEAVNVAAVMATMGANSGAARKLLLALLPATDKALKEASLHTLKELQGSMKFAIMTEPSKRNPETIEKLKYLHPTYF